MKKLSNFSASSLVFDQILQKQRVDTKSNVGLGYHQVPPPKDYLPMPVKDNVNDLMPIFTKIDIKPVKPSVAIKISKPELVKAETIITASPQPETRRPESVRANSSESEDSKTQKVEKVKPIEAESIKPKNVNVKTENKEKAVLNKKGKAKAEPKKEILKETKNVKPNTKSSKSSFQASNEACSHKWCNCFENASFGRAKRFIPQSKPFVEQRSCFYCKKQGHLINDCQMLAKIRVRRDVSRNFKAKKSHKFFSMKVSSSSKSVKKVNNTGQPKSRDKKPNVVTKPKSTPKQV